MYAGMYACMFVCMCANIHTNANMHTSISICLHTYCRYTDVHPHRPLYVYVRV